MPLTDGPLNIFVYGTLKPGYSGYQQFCRPYAVRSTAARAKGQLYHLPLGYPAMTTGDDWVQGYRLSFPNLEGLAQAKVLAALDAYEDYDPNQSAAHNLYQRLPIEIFAPPVVGVGPVGGDPPISLGTAWGYLMLMERVSQLQGKYLPTGNWQA